jgi:hypothetical protein
MIGVMRRFVILAALVAACQTPTREAPEGRVSTETHPDYAQIRPVSIAVLPVEAPAYGLKRPMRREAYDMLFDRHYSPFRLDVIDAHMTTDGQFDAGSLEWDATLDIEVTDWKVVPGTRFFAGDGRATLRHKTGEVIWSCKFENYNFEVGYEAGQIDNDAAGREIARFVVDRMPERPPLPRE